MDIVIIGTGGMAKEIYGLCATLGYNVAGFVSERPPAQDEAFMGHRIIAHDADFVMMSPHNVIIACGYPTIREKIRDYYTFSGHYYPTIVHPDNAILGYPELGAGVTIMPGSVIQPLVEIGDFCHINMGVTIGHDVVIGDYCVVNHNAGISGNVHIGRGCLIGAGAIIVENHIIGDGATVGAGAVVTKDIPPGETWVGVPAKPLIRKCKPTYAELYGVQ